MEDTQTPVEAPSEVELLAGVPENTEVNGEFVVADLDENGTVVGWHKEIR